jgi:hypothetical protein
MDPLRLRALLEAVEAGGASVDEAMRELRELPFRALEFAHVDTHRHLRTGFPEVVLGEGKTPEQIAAILVELAKGGSTALATRVTPPAAAVVVGLVPGARHAGAARHRRRARAPPIAGGRSRSSARGPPTSRSPRRPRSRPSWAATASSVSMTSASPGCTGWSRTRPWSRRPRS